MLSKLYFKRKFKGGDWQGSDTVLSADFADLECEASAKSRYWACVNSNTYGNNDRMYVRKSLHLKREYGMINPELVFGRTGGGRISC